MLFSSDNGPQFGGHGDMCTDRFNCGFAGAKTLVYEGGIRLPMVIRWPAGLDGRRQIHDMIHFTDWLPTLASLAGLEAPADLKLDGANIVPVLRAESGKVPSQRFWQWNRYTPDGECNAAMRDGKWKLVRPAIRELMFPTGEDFFADTDSKYHREKYSDIDRGPLPKRDRPPAPPPQLFDLKNDPFERVDLATSHPERVTKMTNELARWFEEVELDRRTIGSGG